MTTPSFISLDTLVIKTFDDPKHCMNPTKEQSKTSGAASTVLSSSYSSTLPTYTSVSERMPSVFRVEPQKNASGSTIPSPKTRTYTPVVQPVDEGGSDDDHVKEAETPSPSHSESERTSSVFWVAIPRVKNGPDSAIPSPKPSPTTDTSVVQSVDEGNSDDHVKEAETRSPSHSESGRMSKFFWFDLSR